MDPKRGQTRIVLRRDGLLIKIQGERREVEDLYQEIGRDLSTQEEMGEPSDVSWRQIWVYLRTAYLNKLYVVDHSSLGHSLPGRFLDTDRIRRVYSDHKRSLAMAGVDPDATVVWAEVTEEGREVLRKAQAGEG